MRKLKYFYESLTKKIEENHIKHVQLLLTRHDGKIALKFTSCDNDRYKQKVKEICDQYCESLALVRETKTTLVYAI